jgi:hypothetical protein
MRLATFYPFVLSIAAAATAPTLPRGQHPPQFAAYPAPATYTGRCLLPKLVPQTPAWQFRTRIREVARQRPNFAGHYVLATWGCGAECVSYVIVDTTSGQVYFDDLTICCWGMDVADSFQPVDFRLTSRLIIFNGLLREVGNSGPHYYKFQDGHLLALR